ncbi:MAG: RNA polymerase sigma factor [Myxococcales bacterium]|nr:RNA polymerase sigma factor [Myxococcales bacterium]
MDPRVSAVIAGDRHTASVLLLELLPRIRNLIRYLIRGDQAVDDIAQEAMIAVLRGLPSYRGEGSLRAYSDRIVARVALSWARRDRRQKDRERESAVQQEPSASIESPEQYLLRRQAVARLDRLPYEQRHALVLHHVVGLSVPEVAQQLSVPIETVRSRLRLAQNKLRQIEQEPHDPGLVPDREDD